MPVKSQQASQPPAQQLQQLDSIDAIRQRYAELQLRERRTTVLGVAGGGGDGVGDDRARGGLVTATAAVSRGHDFSDEDSDEDADEDRLTGAARRLRRRVEARVRADWPGRVLYALIVYP